MKKIKLFLLCAFVRHSFFLSVSVVMATSFCWGQEIEWQNTIGGSGAEDLRAIQQTSDGGYVLAGYSSSNISGDKTENNMGFPGSCDYWIVKTDLWGNIVWQNTIGGSESDFLNSIQQTSDGGYIVGGYSYSNISGDKTNNNWDTTLATTDYWIVKLDFMGNILWQRTFGGDGNDMLSSVFQTSDGGYIIGGYSTSNISGDKTENSMGGIYQDYWIIKTDSSGNIQWQNTIGGNKSDILRSLKQTNDGGYIIAGHSDSDISGDKTENNLDAICNPYCTYDYWIVKLDSIGNIQWQNTIGGTNDDNLFSVEQTSDGGYILGGYSNSNISADKTENTNGDYDYWIVKTDSGGNVQWQNTIGGSNYDYLYFTQQTSDNGYVLGGCSLSNTSGDKTESSQGMLDIWIIKTDELGNILWQNTNGGGYQESAYATPQTTDGGYIIGGYSNSNISGDKTENNIGGGDYWLVKHTGNYNLIAGKMFGDLNSNNIQDLGEPLLTQNKITEANTNRFAFSQPNGFYSISVLDTGNFTVAPTQINFYNTVPVTHSATFTGAQQTDSLNDFAFQPAGVFDDVCVKITPFGQFRSGFNASYMINYGNYGTTTIAPTLIFFPYSNITYLSASVTPTSVAPDSVVWALPALTPFQTGSIVVTVNVSTGLPIGTLINSSVRIEPIANDANPACNYSHWEVLTIGSYDPNDILVSEDTLLTNQLPTAPWLDYIIRFQNTGNDTAFTVKVLNPIDTNKLNLQTFEFLNSSHPVNLNWINYQRNMEFKFDNILLPDSNVNEPLSHGFVHYRIKPKTTLLAGDSVTNNAYIYFDFNSPVATNTAVTKVVLPAGIAQVAIGSMQLVVYPNPTKDEISVGNYRLAEKNKKAEIKVFDVFGKVIFSTITTTLNYKLRTSNYPQGIYFVQVSTLRAKFVKQ